MLVAAYKANRHNIRKKPNAAVSLLDDDMEVLNLRNHYLGKETGFRSFILAIPGASCLRSIDCTNCFLSLNDVTTLVGVALSLPSLQILNISQNEIFIEGGKQLLRLCQLNKEVVCVDGVNDDRALPYANYIPPRITCRINKLLEVNMKQQNQL